MGALRRLLLLAHLGPSLRLDALANHVAVSGLLVVGLGAGYGADRVYDTLIGAGVDMTVSLLSPSRRNLRASGEALAGLADDLADLLADMDSGLPKLDKDPDLSTDWLRRSRVLN